MEYKARRIKQSNELYHAKEGEERENYKYIARVLLKKTTAKNGKKQNLYRYFYDKKSYQAYLNSKKSKVQNKNFEKTKVSSFFDKLRGNVKDTSNNNIAKIEKTKISTESLLKENAIKKVSEVGSSYESNTNLKDAVSFLIGGFVGYTVNKLLNKKDESKEELIKPIIKPSQIKPMVDLLNDESEAFKRGIRLSNGKYKIFNNNYEYQSYQERLEYQQNEPDFMKRIPNIHEDDIFTAMEDMEKVNELYDGKNDAYAQNCGNCSAAYELRRRGYDVEAKPYDEETYNGALTRFYDYFDNPEIIAINEDGSTVVHNEGFLKRVFDDSYTLLDCIKYKEDYNFFRKNQSYTTSSIEKAIKDNNPPGSRGMIDVYWKLGSGHSIVYEVNTKGEVIIRDSQTYDEYSLDEIVNRVSRVWITRTDNLELKEGILDTVKVNENKKRSYYRDKHRMHKY